MTSGYLKQGLEEVKLNKLSQGWKKEGTKD